MKGPQVLTMFTQEIEPFAMSIFLIVAFMLGAVCHAVWLLNPISKPLAIPIDGGRRFRGKRIFGDNKTWRGFVVMVPVMGLIFALFGAYQDHLPQWLTRGMWPYSPLHYGLLGLLGGFSCMAAELPNSFVKRQLNIAPGKTGNGRKQAAVFFVLDHFDSVLGVLIALSLTAPVPWQTWGFLLVIGPITHLMFSALLFVFKGKERLA